MNIYSLPLLIGERARLNKVLVNLEKGFPTTRETLGEWLEDLDKSIKLLERALKGMSDFK